MINLQMKPTICGQKVILRPFRDADIETMLDCLRDPEVIRLTGSSNQFDQQTIIQWYQTRNDQKDRLDLAIVDKIKDIVVGEVVINQYDEHHHSMNFRILIGSNGRNLGFGTEATKLICDYMFSNTDIKQLTLTVYAFNPRAKRVYEKIGFEVIGIDKDDLEVDGQYVDAINMRYSRDRWNTFKHISLVTS